MSKVRKFDKHTRGVADLVTYGADKLGKAIWESDHGKRIARIGSAGVKLANNDYLGFAKEAVGIVKDEYDRYNRGEYDYKMPWRSMQYSGGVSRTSGSGRIRKPSKRNSSSVGEKVKYEMDDKGSSRLRTVSFQNDATYTYKKRRVSFRKMRRRCRRYNRFLRREMATAPNHVLRRLNHGTFNTAAGAQGYGYIPALYSLYGTADTADDMWHIADNYASDWNLSSTVSGTESINQQTKIVFSSAKIEIDFANQGDDPCIVEWYVMKARNKRADGASIGNFTAFQTLNVDSPKDETAMDMGIEYVTPFDNPNITKSFIIKSVKKCYLSPGEAQDMGFVIKGQKVFNPSILKNMTANSAFVWPGFTTFLFCIVSGAPAATGVGTGVGFSASNVCWTSARTYNFKVFTKGLTTQAITTDPVE